MTRMLWLLVITSCLLGSGCQTLSETSFFGFGEEKAPTGKPTEVVAFWQEGVDVQLDPRQGGVPIPGFSGRVLFHHQKPGKPAETVAVTGTLLISLYDDRPHQGPAQPLETWKILPEHMPQLMRKDLSGWGYALWLPWNTYNPNMRSCRLTVEFTTADGNVLRSEPTPILIQDARRGGMPKPQLEMQQVKKQTWQ
ncbi:MAG: hypothetical protein U0796_08245 [Gemmatales bacterium]